MATILDEINAHKRKEIEANSSRISVNELKLSPFFKRETNSLKASLKRSTKGGIIAEFKTRSPSKGLINGSAEVTIVTSGYARAGVAGISVLTDNLYFGGSFENLAKARRANPLMPVLRKDFMLEPYQIYEAKAHGADVILLIAASLEKKKLAEMAQLAKDLGLEVLFEIYTEEELQRLPDHVDVVGVNNRNLKTFEVAIENSVRLGKLLPESMIRVSESGLSSVDDLLYLKKQGFHGFLMGESFMRSEEPGMACEGLIREFLIKQRQS